MIKNKNVTAPLSIIKCTGSESRNIHIVVQINKHHSNFPRQELSITHSTVLNISSTIFLFIQIKTLQDKNKINLMEQTLFIGHDIISS